MSLMRYTGERLIKAVTGRALDATMAGNTSLLGEYSPQGFSLIQGVNKPGWAIGIDGSTVRTLPDAPDSILTHLRTNEVVYACMRERTKSLITPRFVVERRQPDGTYEVDDDHPLTNLLRRPGEHLDTASFWRAAEGSYSATGRLYLEPIYRGRMLEAVNPLNPAWVRTQYDAFNRVDRYIFQPPGTQPVEFGIDDLIVRRNVPWADVPPLVAALGAVEADYIANTYVSQFFAGGGIPSGIVKVKGTWNETLTTSFRAKWMEIFGGGNRVPAILDENIDSYTRVGLSLNELDNETLRMFVETRICMCFGVPPLIIYAYAGLIKATYSNLQEAWSSYWDATALPLLAEWADWLNWSLLTRYEDALDVRFGKVRCRFDVSEIGPYQEDVGAKATMYREGYEAGAIKLNEYRAALGLPEDTNGDVYKAPPQPPVPYILPPTTPPVAQAEPSTDAPEPPQPPDTPKASPVQVKASQSVTERHVQQYIEGEYAKANRLLKKTGDVEATIAALDEALDDGLDLAAILAPGVRKETERAYVAARRQKATVRPQTLTDAIDRAVERMAARTKDMARTTREAITSTIRAGLDLLAAGREAAPNRADTITTHERLEATNEGTLTGFDDGGVDTVRWVLGPNPCEICIPLAGQTYKLADVIAGRTPSQPQHVRCQCSWDGVESEGAPPNE